MLNGCRLLANLKATSGETSDYFTYHSVKIKSSSLDRGIKFYRMGIDKFLGNCLIKQLENKQFKGVDELRAALSPEIGVGPGKWVDLAGLFAPEEAVQKMLSDIEDGTINTLEQLTEHFRSMHESYEAYEWAWAEGILQQCIGKTVEKITADDVIEVVRKWKTAVVELDRMLYADARKEFAATAQTGFGLDGNEETKHSDFEQVRGIFEKNSFVSEIEKHIISKTALGDELIGRMENLR
ncbi:unnamed protein product [marine sediment metagenome]|uniref:DUF6819 domain-containing protein n=1 Tax=marine sediment metagenome TaxID=412755 RepID=X0TBP7_9ZZZZ